jgi:cytidine deaminase
MKEIKIEIAYNHYNSIDELPGSLQALLNKAKETTQYAYAPYSHFKVAAAARLVNGKIITGTNQENASFPAGLCAERVLLSSISSQYPDVAIEAIAISYQSANQSSDHPVAPCGICRQTLLDYEGRQKSPIQVVLGGTTGEIYVINSVTTLLPLAFTSGELL